MNAEWIKNLTFTITLCFGYLALLVLGSCLDTGNEFDPMFDCGPTQPANATDIEVLYGPFTNDEYSTESDTVSFDDFTFNIKLEVELLTESSLKNSLPGQAFALSCAPIYTLRNLSNISVILTAPFAGLQTGTDISYLISLQEDGTLLSEFRDFREVFSIFSTKLDKAPDDLSQLKTRTVLFLKNGEQVSYLSSSPVLKTN